MIMPLAAPLRQRLEIVIFAFFLLPQQLFVVGGK
jgi:hypothetical protein